jgi:phage replication-related protein YjqB (UPF0714/DUF867 family)
MLDGSHSYFAYGSNLCVNQMARRCPSATDPRPAMLADHDWLINERGVATVEPFDGSQVHGVVWQLDDHDLAVLDSAEGVPVRYRRDRLTVHTDAGPAEAWVYVDHRVDPGPPRPGYLERIIDGALHHGLPHRWIEFLRRWDPSQWPVPKDNSKAGAPQSLSELLADSGVLEECTLRSRFGFMAIHGHPENYPHHLPSARYRAEESERLTEFLDHVDVAISLHGYGRLGRSTQLLAGGRNRALAAHLARHITVPGYHVVTDLDAIPRELRGMHPDNPVNRVRDGGAQLELTPRLRGISPRSAPADADGLSPPTSALIQGLVAAAHSWKST